MKHIAIIIVVIGLCLRVNGQESINREKVLATMINAADYMANTVSMNGGYVHMYSEDLSVRMGEGYARESQIWIQSSTPRMGHIYLDAYEVTAEPKFLEYAKDVANALIAGQHSAGGWHYFVDFDPVGTQIWFDNISSQYVEGRQEHRYNFGNCTFDDNTTAGAATYLMRLYMSTLDPAYKATLDKALNFVLEAQYPNGAWPQRYPLLDEDTPLEFPKYPNLYTLNDGVHKNNIALMLEAFENFGDERYLEAAKKGGRFLMISQGPKEQAAWAQQFNFDLLPEWGRTHEPAAYMPRVTRNAIEILERIYLFTGDRRYLRPIEYAIDWLDKNYMDDLGNGVYNFPWYIEAGTNKIIDRIILEDKDKNGYALYDYFCYEKGKDYKYKKSKIDLTHLKKQYSDIKNIDEDNRIPMYEKLYKKKKSYKKVSDQKVIDLIYSVNNDGIWIEDFTYDAIEDPKTTKYDFDDGKGRYIHQKVSYTGIVTKTFMKNMNTMLSWIMYLD